MPASVVGESVLSRALAAARGAQCREVVMAATDARAPRQLRTLADPYA